MRQTWTKWTEKEYARNKEEMEMRQNRTTWTGKEATVIVIGFGKQSARRRLTHCVEKIEIGKIPFSCFDDLLEAIFSFHSSWSEFTDHCERKNAVFGLVFREYSRFSKPLLCQRNPGNRCYFKQYSLKLNAWWRYD